MAEDSTGSEAPTLVAEDSSALAGTLLATRWESRGVTVDLLQVDEKGTLGRGFATIAGVLPPDADAAGMEIIRAAPRENVDLGEVIGEGAMGVVRTGHQHHLRRTVAVKEPRSETATDESIGAMLREAWISGNLEHPNIVPIHVLSRDGDRPLIVMKHIAGRPWSEVLRDTADAGAGEDWLEAQLGVLMEVCHAVHFAHSRGALHLDLKPDNVMVGEFGEVYVLDWGVAAGFGPERPEWMPDATAIRSVVGTPGYLSPEQAEGDGARFGVHTDVYLLGAVAHELLTGERLHGGSLVTSLISSHRAEPPEYDGQVSPELADIVRRAVAAEPEDRWPDVEALRLALEAFLTHRRSTELTRGALDRLDTIRALAPSHSAETDLGAALDNENTVAECRFALQQALRIWPDNQTAASALTDLLTLLVHRACDAGDLPSAATALAEHPAPTTELQEAVAELRKRLRAERAEAADLRKLGEQLDLGRFGAQRVALAAVCCFAWFFWNYGLAWLDKSDTLPVSGALLCANVVIGAAAFGVLVLFVGKTMLMATEMNRRAVAITFCAFVATGVLWLGCWVEGIEPHKAASLAPSVWVAATAALAVGVDKRVYMLVPFMLIPAVGAVLDPANAFEWSAWFGPIGGLGLVLLWRPTAESVKTSEVAP